MANYYFGVLSQLKRDIMKTDLALSERASSRLNEIAEAMVSGHISDNDYIMLLELFYEKYRRTDQRVACKFCVMRIQNLAYLKKHPVSQSTMERLEFHPGLDEETKQFLRGKPRYLKNLRETYIKRILLICVVLAILLMMFLVLLLHFPFIVGWILAVACGLVGFFMLATDGFEYIEESQIQSCGRRADKILSVLDISLHSLVQR